MKLKEERWRENQLNVNDDQQSGAEPEGEVSHLVLLCFVLCVCVCFKKLFVPAGFYFPPEMELTSLIKSTCSNGTKKLYSYFSSTKTQK